VCDGDNCAASHTALVNVAGAGVGPAADGVVQASAATVILDGFTFRASK
jgi:hypothetical protein